MKRRLYRTAIAAGILTLLLACAESNRRPVIPPPAKGETGPREPLLLNGKAGFEGVGGQAASALKKLLQLDRYEHIAVGWNGNLTFMTAVGDALSSMLPGATPLRDLGVLTNTRRQAFDQLDPSSFSALIWLSPDLWENDRLSGLHVHFMPTNGGSPTDILFTCRPPAGPPSQKDATPSQSTVETRWIKLEEKPIALGWESAAGRLWVSGAKTIFVFAPNDWKRVASFHLPAPAEDRSAGPSVLREVLEDTGLSSMGWFDLGRRFGRLYVNGPGGLPQPAAVLDGFPLSTREARFLKAPEDEVEKAFSLADFRDQELGLCVDIVRFRGPAGSLFAFLQQDGTIGVVEGRNLTVVNGPTTEPVSAVAAFLDTLIAAKGGDHPVVEGYVMTTDYTWKRKWSIEVPNGEILSVCTGLMNGKRVIFTGMTRKGEGGIVVKGIPR